MRDLKLYSTHCPRCNILEKKLAAIGINYELIDDENVVLETAKEYNIMEAPFMIIDGKCYNFSESIKAINSLLN